MARIGIADTLFARYDMAALAVKTLEKNAPEIKIERYTVPGFKDLPVAAKKLIEEYCCDIVLCLGMAGKEPIDKQCAHEASTAIQEVQLRTNKHILEVFVHEDEGKSPSDLISIFENRTQKHTLNAIELLKGKTALTPFAGQGKRQGRQDAGPLSLKRPTIAIIVSDFNNDITSKMLEIAKEKIGTHAIVRIIHVPGCFEIPLAVQRVIQEVDGAVTLAVVIQGKTSHDKSVAENAIRKIADLSLEFRKPIGLGILGPRISRAIAEERYPVYAEHAANAALKMVYGN